MSLRHFKRPLGHVIGVPEEEAKGEKAEKTSKEIIANVFLNLMKTVNPQIQEVQ